VERVTQRSRIADDLLSAIRTSKYPVGTKLPSERILAEEYGVSRPVVREALGMLSSLDVLEIQMGRGAFVLSSDVSVEQPSDYTLIDIVDAREAIESGAIRLTAARARRTERTAVDRALRDLEHAVTSGIDTSKADMALHQAIVHAARSPLLEKLFVDMTDEIAQTIRISPHGRAMSAEILRDHKELAEGVIDDDLAKSLSACGRLYDDHRKFLRALLG
jgi:GntR family transcriptional regulator, transcriptional repressor for pyruvate dehydrogenase complex